MKIIGRILTAVIFLTIGYGICYFGWLPQIIDFFKGIFSK